MNQEEEERLFKSTMSNVGPYKLLEWALRGDPDTGENLFDTLARPQAESLRQFLTELNNDR